MTASFGGPCSPTYLDLACNSRHFRFPAMVKWEKAEEANVISTTATWNPKAPTALPLSAASAALLRQAEVIHEEIAQLRRQSAEAFSPSALNLPFLCWGRLPLLK